MHATANGDVAVTDNVFSVSRDSASAESDIYTQLRPGVLFTWETPRMIQTLEASAEILEYATHSNTDPTFSLFGKWDSLWTPGPRSQFGLGASAGNGHISALTSRNAPDQTPVGVIPSGDSSLRQAEGHEYLSWQATRDTRTSQLANFQWVATDDNLAMPTTTSSYTGTFGLGFDHLWTHDTVGVQVSGSVLHLERIAPMGANPPSRLDQQLNPAATLGWRHDYSKHWSSNINGGIVYVNPYGSDPYNPGATDRVAAPFPVATGTVAYTDVWGGANLTLGRTVAPNLYIAQNTVVTGAIAKLTLPLPWLDSRPRNGDPLFTLLGTLGVDQTQLIDSTTSKLQGAFEIGRMDVALQWQPSLSQKYAVRYEFVYQHGDTIASQVTPSYYRNTIYFEFSWRYPELVATQVPRRSGASNRADGADMSPVGAEPVVPDAAEPSPASFGNDAPDPNAAGGTSGGPAGGPSGDTLGGTGSSMPSGPDER